LIGLNKTIDWFRSSKPLPRRIAGAGLVVLVTLNVWVSVGFATIGQHRRQHDEVCLSLTLVSDCLPPLVNHN